MKQHALDTMASARPLQVRDIFSAGLALAVCAVSACMLGGCRASGRELQRTGEEIMVAGRMFQTGTRVVLWIDPGGYDAYRVQRRFAKPDESEWEHIKDALNTPNRYGTRRVDLTDQEQERVRGGGWDLSLLREHVDQFVLHYDACGTSRQCFQVLHDERGLSVHFLLDVDGTIYQTLDVKERAWHATKSNDRSVGVEIAHPGAFRAGSEVAARQLARWYSADERGVFMLLPAWMGDGGVATPGFVARPARGNIVSGSVNGEALVQMDFTPEQYAALGKLVRTLHVALPGIRLDVPRDGAGRVLQRVLTDEEWRGFSGVLGHSHVQQEKIDPGPAMDYERVLRTARGE